MSDISRLARCAATMRCDAVDGGAKSRSRKRQKSAPSARVGRRFGSRLSTIRSAATQLEEEKAWTRARVAVERRLKDADEDVYALAVLGEGEEVPVAAREEYGETTSTSNATHAMDVLAFRRLSAMMSTYEKNVETHGIARQVVVITAGGDTRAFRLPFPIGTAIFECADGQVHTEAAARLKAVGAKPSRGCSHRRVPLDATAENVPYGDLEERLERAGYRSDVRSIWLVQDVHSWNHARLATFLTESSDIMTTGSEIIIDMSGIASSDDIVRREFASNGVMPEIVRIPEDEGREAIRLVLGFVQRVSLKESEYYREQLLAAEDEADEDGFED